MTQCIPNSLNPFCPLLPDYYVDFTDDIHSLNDLKWFVNLKSLVFNFGYEPKIRIYDDIANIANLIKLENITLSYTNVTGNLSSLSKLKNFDWIDVHKTNVGGDLSSLVTLDHLKLIDLSETEVRGDLSVLSDLRGLFDINVKNTNVFGKVTLLNGKVITAGN